MVKFCLLRFGLDEGLHSQYDMFAKCAFNTITTGETNTATGIKTHIAHR